MSQVNFFMLEGDEREFFAYLRSRTDTAIFRGFQFPTPSPEPLRSLPDPELRLLTIAHTDLAKVYPPRQESAAGLYAFPLFRSAWVEWTRSSSIEGRLESGRIFAKVGWLPEPVHNRIYRSWYAAIERWLKRRLSRLDNTWWIGSGAETWSRAGGVLAFGPGPSMRRSLAEE